MDDIVEKFKTARKAQNHSQVDASVIVRCSLSTIGKFENQGMIPTGKAVLENIKNYIKDSYVSSSLD